MGADLLLARIKRVPIEGAHRRIDDLDDENLNRAWEYATGDILDPDDEYFADHRAEAVEWFHGAAESVFNSPESRNVIHETIGGEEYVTAGGTSWGDSPCDEFDYICALLETGAFV